MSKYQRLTLQERIKISELLKQGKSRKFIHKELNKSLSTLHKEIAKNGGNEIYCPYLADNRAKINQEEKIKRLAEENKKRQEDTTRNLPYYKVKEKIKNLEFQVEILFDIINNKQQKT